MLHKACFGAEIGCCLHCGELPTLRRPLYYSGLHLSVGSVGKNKTFFKLSFRTCKNPHLGDCGIRKLFVSLPRNMFINH